MKIAYLLGSVAGYSGEVTGQRYKFSPWANVDDRDWPGMQHRKVVRGGCCGKPRRVERVFGTENEVREGLVATHWR